jgi:hypothetical protein
MRYFDVSLDDALDLLLTGHCPVYENWKALG